MFDVRRGSGADAESCLRILRALPDSFTEDACAEFTTAVRTHPLWIAEDDELPIGFVLAERRYSAAAEITFAAVDPHQRARGVGRRLVSAAFESLTADGVRFVEVKTLDESAGYEPYVATRAFWEACGFVQIDCIDPLPGWSPGNPSAIYVAAIE
jgi:ribosomal protein S18 acetylase RimI-like enzyme